MVPGFQTETINLSFQLQANYQAQPITDSEALDIIGSGLWYIILILFIICILSASFHHILSMQNMTWKSIYIQKESMKQILSYANSMSSSIFVFL